ncbi:MAG TPA: 2Fe-2S iron-sulfur cluster-binding protein, partial [Myxococcota bacterium]|nr:2Fe-2S iron-sulfur cluster-binding protein [Myxococcota bacterium]
MRDHVLLYINGQRHAVRGAAVYRPLTDLLRDELGLCGTKVVCAEGDCGACTVLVGRPAGDRMDYAGVDGCIQYLWQLDGRSVVTVEGLQRGAELHPAQRAMIDHHGSQCGYCTPGFVMALAMLREEGTGADSDALRLGLSGQGEGLRVEGVGLD